MGAESTPRAGGRHRYCGLCRADALHSPRPNSREHWETSSAQISVPAFDALAGDSLGPVRFARGRGRHCTAVANRRRRTSRGSMHSAVRTVTPSAPGKRGSLAAGARVDAKALGMQFPCTSLVPTAYFGADDQFPAPDSSSRSKQGKVYGPRASTVAIAPRSRLALYSCPRRELGAEGGPEARGDRTSARPRPTGVSTSCAVAFGADDDEYSAPHRGATQAGPRSCHPGQ